jgi:hypothetical protein
MLCKATQIGLSLGRSIPAIRAIAYHPCLCLCFGFSQITLTTPPRLITLHFLHIGLTEALTFISNHHPNLAMINFIS